MIDKDILEGLAEHKDINVSYRSKNIKCGKESCQKCPHGPYWYAEWTENGKRRTKYLGKTLSEV